MLAYNNMQKFPSSGKRREGTKHRILDGGRLGVKKTGLRGKGNGFMNNPVRQKNVFCFMCFAYLNFCPRDAVRIRDIPWSKIVFPGE
jgi:hypothetical protein